LALAFALVLPAFAQSVKFSVSPAKLKPGEKGVLKATLTIADPEKKQNYDPAYGEDDYFNLVPDGNYPNLKFGKTQYPAPTQKTEGIWEYHKSVTLSKPFTLDKNAKPGKLDLKATMTYGLCHKTSGFCDPQRMFRERRSWRFWLWKTSRKPKRKTRIKLLTIKQLPSPRKTPKPRRSPLRQSLKREPTNPSAAKSGITCFSHFWAA